MKRMGLLFSIVFITVFCTASLQLVAQPRHIGSFKPEDYKEALKAGTMNLRADKELAELKETVTLTVTMVVVGSDGVPVELDYNPLEPTAAPYRVESWRIVEGGGRIVPAGGANNYYAVLHTPETMPAGKAVTIEASLVPIAPGAAAVKLLQTVYLENNDNAFYINFPAFGILQEKWVAELGDGSKVKIPKEAAATNGMNLAALISKCRAVYIEDADATSITIQGGELEQRQGARVGTKNNFIINLSIPGRAKGVYQIKTEKKATVGITLPLQSKTCSCYDDPEEKARRDSNGEKGPTCNGGYIRIEEVGTGKNAYMKGSFVANVEGVVDGHVVYGDVEGKFKVLLAN